MDICCKCKLELPYSVNEIKETYFEIYTKQVACPLASSFKQFNLPIPVTIWNIYLHDSCITIFDCMNYAFAKLVVAW